MLAFNPDGDTIRAWGGPGEGFEWPESMHGVFVDHKGNVWLGGNGAKDAQVGRPIRIGWMKGLSRRYQAREAPAV